MKILAYGMIAVGFLIAALVSVQETQDIVAWEKYSPCLLLGVIGVIMIQKVRRRETRDATVGGGSLQKLVGSIGRIVENISVLNTQKHAQDTGDIHVQIDRLFRSDLAVFADARKSISNLYGLEAYAKVMNEFAAGERYLNRVWSASVDGYIDEVKEYLKRARFQFEQTETLLKGFIDSTNDCN